MRPPRTIDGEENAAVCRILAYVGDPLALDEPLFGADRALVRQAVDPQLMSLLNLGGFGLVAWDGTSAEPDRPFSYRTPHIPVYDRNLKALAEKVRATALLAHVRGVVYDPGEVVGPHNVHPFKFPGTSIAMAQNGDLYDFARMRYDLVEHISPDLARRIEGTTDTEWLYALVLSQLDDPAAPVDAQTAADAIQRALEIVREARERHAINIQSPVNLVVSDGRWLIATRFVFDYGWYPDDDSFFANEREHDFTSLWFSAGPGVGAEGGGWGEVDGAATRSILVASEPLTHDRAMWAEAPEYCVLTAEPVDGELRVDYEELAV
jgi:glutamine amidotransferase